MMEDVKLWLQEHYLPVVLVAATPAAEAIASARNGLSIADMLRPYSHVAQMNASMRVGELTWRVQDMRLRFHTASTAFQPKAEVFETHLQEGLQAAAVRYAKMEPQLGLLDAATPGVAASTESLTPWFFEYREEFLRMLRFGDHEAIDHPVACIYVVPCDVVNAVSHFQTLETSLAPLPLVAQEAMAPLKDKELPKHYVLLQDGAEDVDLRKMQDNLAAVRRTFGEPHCSVLKINTARGDKQGAGAPAEFFKRFQRPVLPGGGAGELDARIPLPPQGLGAYLSGADLDAVAAFVRDFATVTLLPRLEDRISRLNVGITAARRGLRNRLTRFWKPSGDAAAGSTAGGENQPYPHHSIESQMRQLADLAFLLQRYEFAESMYRLAAQDYLANGNNKWYAGAEEMIGLCCVLEPSDGNDPLKYFSRAYEHYSKVAGKGGRVLATRSMLLCAAYQRSVGRHLSTSHVLMRAHFEEENARAALLLEQAAYALLSLEPPSTRKFAFQMVLAGLRYHSCAQKRLAINAYRQVMGVYHGKLWRSIEEHLNDVLGKQCREVGDTERALWHFMSLLECSHRPAATQQHYLAQFLDAVRKARVAPGVVAVGKDGTSADLDSLELPLFNHTDVRVAFSDQVCRGNEAAQGVPDMTWLRLEAAVAAGADAGGGNWLDGGKHLRDHEEYNVCVAGEDVCVNIEVRNPLHIKLRVSAVRLTVEFTPLDDPSTASGTPGGTAGGTGQPSATSTSAPAPVSATAAAATVALGFKSPLTAESSSDSDSDGPAEALHPLADDRPPWQRSEQVFIQDDKFTLHGGEVLMEQLHVRPLVPGWLRITGLQWLLNDTVEGHVLFDVKGRHRKTPKGPRAGQRKHFPPTRRLLFSVIPAMPRLEVVADDIPTQLYQGELCRVCITLQNSGTLPLRSLQLVVGHPEVACPTSNACVPRRPLLEALQDPFERVEPERLPAAMEGRGIQVVRAWPGRELQPGERLEWPLWLHPRGVGMLRFSCVWCCEPTVAVPTMKYRTLRLSYAVQVVPLLSLRPLLSATPHDLYAYQLRLGIENSKDGASVAVRQLTCLTRGREAGSREVGWRLARVAGPTTTDTAGSATTPSPSLMPGVVLQAGESNVANYQLLPPRRPAAIGCALAPHIGSQADGGDAGGTAGRTDPEELDTSTSMTPGALDFERGGILAWFYGQQRQAPPAASSKGSSLAAAAASAGGGGRAAAAASSALPQPPAGASRPNSGSVASAAALAPEPSGPSGTAGSGTGATPGLVRPGGPSVPPVVPPADPAVDVVAVWRLVESAAAVGGAVVPRDRFGACRFRDVCSTIKVAPIRMVLLGPSTVRHDFRQGAMCVVPLRLAVRNCCGCEAKLQVEAGEGWQGGEPQHAWTASLAPAGGNAPHNVVPQGAQPPLPPPIMYQAGLAPSTEYVWCGTTYVNIPGLAPGEDTEVPLQVAVFRPGTYAVTGYRCTYILESPVSVIDTQRGEPFLVKVEAV